MKIVLLSATVTFSVFVADLAFAGAAVSQNGVAVDSPATATASLPLTACSSGDSLGKSCRFEKPYSPGEMIGGGFFRGSFFAFPGHESLLRKFNAGYDLRRRRMKHCLAQKPSPYQEQLSRWISFPRFRYANPFPSNLGSEPGLNDSRQALADYLYCM